MRRRSRGQRSTCAFGRGTTTEGRKVRWGEQRASCHAARGLQGALGTRGWCLGKETHSPCPRTPHGTAACPSGHTVFRARCRGVPQGQRPLRKTSLKENPAGQKGDDVLSKALNIGRGIIGTASRSLRKAHGGSHWQPIFLFFLFSFFFSHHEPTGCPSDKHHRNFPLLGVRD